MKRIFDLIVSLVAFMAFLPLFAILALLVWLEDKHDPLYRAARVGLGGEMFSMLKFRSMVPKADSLGGASTADDDVRITGIGKFLRRSKLDELPQLFNILRGEMSFVGPRPNVSFDVAKYTEEQRILLSIRPGITDIASIVFSDEGALLAGSSDPDGDFDRLIRPWKIRLGLYYVEHNTLLFDIYLIFLTLINCVSRERALLAIQRILSANNAAKDLIDFLELRVTEMRGARE